MPQTVPVPQLAWHGDTEMMLTFPDLWEVVPCYMRGYRAPRLSDEEMRSAFARPIGSERIRDLARGKREVVVLFDDMTRPTRAYELVPFVLEELAEAGISDRNIRFIATLGAHGAMDRTDFARKLGEKVLDRFPVYNHCPFQNCTYLGQTSRGTPVNINTEVMSCDLKIALGTIMPHISAGFSGGCKAISPGVASMDTIYANHHEVGGRGSPSPAHPLGGLHPTVGIGKVEDNVMRLDIEEIGKMAGLDVIVNVVVNGKREPVGLFVGDPVAAHRKGVGLAREHYVAQKTTDVDILVINSYVRANEVTLSAMKPAPWFKQSGGDLVVIASSPEGQVTHYLSRSSGKSIGGRLWGPRDWLPDRVNRVIVLTPYKEMAWADWLGPLESIIWTKTWEEALATLCELHPDRAKVAVVPDAGLQFFPDS